MNDTTPSEDELRMLLNEHWSPKPVDPDTFSATLRARLRTVKMARRKRRLVWSGGAVAVAAGVFLAMTIWSPGANAGAQGWLQYTTMNASTPLPLPEDYAVLQSVFLTSESP